MDTSKFDVLIIGAGPAGLMAGTWMAQTGVKAMIIDQKSCRTQTGHADGIESRTLEILDSFGIGEYVWKKANRTVELSLWNETRDKKIEREGLLTNCNPGLSRYQESTLGQGEIEQHFLDFIQSHECVEVEWNTFPIDLNISQRDSSHPVELRIQTKISDSKFTERTINAKYLVGCDGAHSWVRMHLGLTQEGDRMNENWGVFDSIPLTDFPDIRKRCIVKTEAGHLMVIPRERRLVRCYVQLPPGIAAGSNMNYNPEILVKLVQKILYPYRFDASQIEWSTIYTVGQRVCQTLSMYNRIFIAGDAVHTHSPKAGQGMNVSIQDTYNLGWKLASVIKGKAHPRILRTYQEERLTIAMRLIAFDKRMVEGVCLKDKFNDQDTSSRLRSLKATLREENTSASGLSACYRPSILVTPAWDCRSPSNRRISSPLLPHSRAELAAGLALGVRFPSAQVLCQSDSRPWHLQQLFQSTGQWNLVIFGGDITNSAQMDRVQNLGKALSRDGSVIHRINQEGDGLVGKVAAYLIHSSSRSKLEWTSLPEAFRPFDNTTGYDYWKVFADNQPHCEGRGRAYRFYGISAKGCLVLLRPDQHVAFIASLEDLGGVEMFLANFASVAAYKESRA
ncbi:Monooxygenase FAD-binding [Penicillium alfredii]|uniref:Monooxygenase FAD-binding n=1 Tax=Penicillium alfredii TaxID=1506179 RepID=A0A9W9KR00_9EURO|nr:Monooxygenase FAD-binding [Penicillium alfredii]KAJ5115005.1 Monooxygenase FAD-binding [Penicillium alfredii]